EAWCSTRVPWERQRLSVSGYAPCLWRTGPAVGTRSSDARDACPLHFRGTVKRTQSLLGAPEVRSHHRGDVQFRCLLLCNTATARRLSLRRAGTAPLSQTLSARVSLLGARLWPEPELCSLLSEPVYCQHGSAAT